jgi:tubulin polyglutamylase TTLL1
MRLLVTNKIHPELDKKQTNKQTYIHTYTQTNKQTNTGKWSMDNFRRFLEGSRGKEATDTMFQDMYWLIVQSLKSVQTVIFNDPHCFEIYGYAPPTPL